MSIVEEKTLPEGWVRINGLNHNHSGESFVWNGRTHYVSCTACTLLNTGKAWPL